MNPQLTTEQALANLKQLLNASIQKGIFQTAEDVLVMIESFNLITQAVQRHNGVLRQQEEIITQ
jgi:hypothetical protein